MEGVYSSFLAASEFSGNGPQGLLDNHTSRFQQAGPVWTF